MSFRDLPIKRKLTSVIMLTSTIVLLATCAAFAAYEVITFRNAMKQNLSTLAQVIAAQSTAAILYSEKDAREILAALKADRHIVEAALYDKHGKLVASFPGDKPHEAFPTEPGPVGQD